MTTDQRPDRHADLAGWLKYHAARWSPVFVLALLTYALFPVTRGFVIAVQSEGEVADEEVLAPFDFEVRKTPLELRRAADQLAATVKPIFDYRGAVVDSLHGALDTFFDALNITDTAETVSGVAQQFGVRLDEGEAEYLSDRRVRRDFREQAHRMLSDYLAAGVGGLGALPTSPSDLIVVQFPDQLDRIVSRDSVLSFGEYLDLRASAHPDGRSAVADQIYVKILTEFFIPTIVANPTLTELQRATRRADVDSVKDRVRANERIIGAHEIITPAASERLRALQQELLDRGEFGAGTMRGILGQVLTNGLIVSVFWVLLSFYILDTYQNLRKILVLAALFSIVVIGAAIMTQFVHRGPELIPIPLAALLITVLFNSRLAVVAAMVLALLVGSQAIYGGLDALYIALIGGVAAALSVRGIRRRSHLLTSTALIIGAIALAAMTVGLRVGWSFSEFGSSVLRGSVNAVMSGALVFLALPIFESLTRVTTDLTLLELSDPSRPLLRRLAMEVPGTYAHSVAVANLSEAACNAIGGNGLLARVGCYYHDIGKMHRPIHFAENQGPSGNPHDRLPPQTSASIIRDHVTEGLALADRSRLPEAVKQFIPEHHGTREISYFLARAREAGDVSDEDIGNYLYPGPIPQSAETAIAMLADGVEAAIRVLEDPTEERLRDAIDHVVKQRVDEGQLEDAPLTLGDLERIKEAFLRSLSGMYHNRIEYPEESGGITARWTASFGV